MLILLFPFQQCTISIPHPLKKNYFYSAQYYFFSVFNL